MSIDNLAVENMRVTGVRKIAVLRPNSLGDYVFSLPALDALRAAYPGAEIVLLGQPWHREFLEGRPGPVDRVIVVPYVKGVCETTERRLSPPGEVERFFDNVNREAFDIVLQMYGGGRHSNPFVRRIKARISAGLKSPEAPSLDRCIPYVFYHPEILRYLEVVSLVGASPVTLAPRLAVTAPDIREAATILPASERPVAVLHPGATDPRRRWPAEKFSAVGDALDGAGARVVITGLRSESAVTAAVERAMRRPAENLCGRLSMGGLAGLLSLARVVVANDTGPLHLGRATGAATVGIYWIGNVINAGPLTLARHRMHPAWRLECPVCGENCTETSCLHDASFVADVPAADVAGSACELFDAGKTGSAGTNAFRHSR